MGLVQTSSSCTCQPCKYALSPPPPHFFFPLLYLLPYTHSLTLTSSHSSHTPHPHTSHSHSSHSSHTPHPHTPHTDTENVFRLMVWVLDDRQKKQLHPSFRLPSCTCQPCMYVITFPTSSTSSHFLFPLLYLLPYIPHTHPSLFLPSHTSPSLLTLTLTLTPHTSPSLLTLTLHHSLLTPHSPSYSTLLTQTENEFPLMVWVLDDRQKRQLHPLTPSHSHTEQSWSGYGQLFILQ